MAGPKRKVEVDIVGDAKGYQKATDDAVKASTGFAGKMDALDRKMEAIGKRGGVTGALLGGVGVGAGLGIFSLVERGIGSVVGALGDAVQAAIEDEKATAQLTQTIEANVRAWDGSLDAVNAAIDAGARLAFTDDEIRDGLNQLIPRTKDLAKATELNALAMDLARAKGMSLEEAATLVGKAFNGQASALKRAGINITNTKDSTAALAELQRTVNGQAKTYANTTEGAMKRLDIQTSEAMESLGYAIKPVIGALVSFAADSIPNIIEGIGNLGSAFDNLHRFIDPNYAAVRDLENAIRELAAGEGVSADAVLEWQKAQEAAIATAKKRADNAALAEAEIQAKLSAQRDFLLTQGVAQEELNRQMTEYEDVLRGVQRAQEDLTPTTTAMDGANQKALDTIDAYWNALDDVIEQWNAIGDNVAYGSTAWSEQNKLMRDNATLLRGAFGDLPGDLREALVAAGIVVRDGSADLAPDDEPAKRSIRSIVRAYEGGVMDMKAAIKSGKAGIIEQMRDLAWQSKHPFAVVNYENWLRDRAKAVTRKMKEATKNGRPDLVEQYKVLYTEITDELRKLPGYAARVAGRILANLDPLVAAGFTWADPGSTYDPDAPKKPKKPKKPRNKAGGGMVEAGEAYDVGEAGRERFIPDTDGYIVPNHALQGGGWAGGGQTVVHVTVNAGVGDPVAIGAEVMKVVRAASRRDGGVAIRAAMAGR